ncbi:WG repeat-containing protein [Kerstersia similis]|uniref:WG repeat-containing protein n=1 Tax=Kerstersia similis TaxID=206505 RepID=UPI0039EF1397
MSYRISFATFLLCALGAAPAQAQQSSSASCVRPVPEHVSAQRTNLDQIAGENRCIQDLSEGMAAVILHTPSQDGYRDADIADGLAGHRWGYIDAQGELAIEPRYEDARPFRHGLAAVRENGLWGYIDKSGQWALPPQWEQAGDFSLAGVAVVRENGRTGLIDTAGASVTPPGLGRSVSTIELDGGSPTRAIIGYRREYLSPTGVRRYVDGQQRVLSQLGNGPFYVATRDGEHQGLLDADWRWVLRPEYDEIIAALPDGMGAARKGEDWYFLDSQTGKAGSERYRHLETLRDAFWLALPATDADSALGSNINYQLLNAQGKVLQPVISRNDLGNLNFAGNTLVYRTPDALTIYPMGGEEALELPATWQQRETYGQYLLFYDENEALAGVVTPTGQLQKIASADLLSGTREVDVQADRLWLFGAQQRVINVIDAQGRRLLNDTARETLANSSYRLLPLNLENAPLAIITTGYCHCEEGGAGLVLHDGRPVRHPDWTEVVLLHEEADLETLENADALRFAAVSENGMIMLDAQGNPVNMEPLQHISPFRHGYALGYAKGVAYLLKPDGTRQELPDYFDVRIVGPNRMAIVMEAAEGALWGLDEIPYYRELVPPQFLEIGDFQDGLAPARHAKGTWGLIDAQGAWAVQPEYDEVAQERSGYWLLRRKTDNSNFSYEWPTVVVSRAGKILTPPLRSLQVQEYGNGYAMVGNSQESWIVGPDGSAFPAGAAYISQIGDWLEVRRDSEAGVLDSQGNWVIPPAPVFLSQVRDQRIMRRAPDGSELLDATGKRVASLGDSDWQWLPGSRYLAGLGYDDEREPVTRFADANGKILATVKGHALGFDGERVLTISRDGAYRWLDRTGQPVGEGHHALGMLHDGLAGALGPDGKHAGYVDKQSLYRIPPTYLAVSRFQNGRAVASTGQASYLLDTSGRPLAWVADECGMRVLRNAAGKAIWPAEQSLSYCY